MSNIHFYNCGDPSGITWDSGDLSSSIVTKTSHGFYSRDSVIHEKGTTDPTGLTDGTRYYILKLDDDRFQFVSSASRVINMPNTSISANADWVNAIGHQFLTQEGVKYIAGTTGVGGLTNENTYYIIRNGFNYFQFTSASSNIKTFGNGDVNTSTNEITITGHPFNTGDAVKLSIGTPSSSTEVRDQLTFELSGSSAYSGNVRAGTTSNNDEYTPSTTYYVIKVDADTVKLARTAGEASSGTAINIVTAGEGTMGLCLASNITNITSQGSGYQTFGVPITVTGGTGTHSLTPDGWGAITYDRCEYIMASNIQITSRGSSRKQNFCYGRLSNSTIQIQGNCNDIRSAWNFNVHGTRGEHGDPGSVPSINNSLEMNIQIDRELYSFTGGNTDGSTGVITNVKSSDIQRMRVGDSVTVSDGFATTGPFEITALSSSNGTVTVDSTSNTSETGVTIERKSSITTPLIASSSTSGVDLRESFIQIKVIGYPDSIAIINPTPSSLRYKLQRGESGEEISGVGEVVGGSNPSFTTTREQQSQSIPFVIGNHYFNDDGTYAIYRTFNGKTLAICDSGGIRNARSTTSRFRTESSSWKGRNLGMGTYVLWVDSTGNLRIKNGSPSSDTDGTIVGTQS